MTTEEIEDAKRAARELASAAEHVERLSGLLKLLNAKPVKPIDMEIEGWELRLPLSAMHRVRQEAIEAATAELVAWTMKVNQLRGK